jgi:DNA-directed RNA polymerase subunit RPC12/RpoP
MFVRGMLCPNCQNEFLWTEGKNKKFTIRGELDCPRCNVRIRNPRVLRTPGLYVKLIFGFFVAIKGIDFLAQANEIVSLFGFVAIIVGYGCLVTHALKIKEGLVQMELAE